MLELRGVLVAADKVDDKGDDALLQRLTLEVLHSARPTLNDFMFDRQFIMFFCYY